MRIHVRVYAGLVAMVGARDVDVDVPDASATADGLKQRIGELYPVAQAFLRTVVCAVDEEYVRGDHALRDGDRVALIPPVSGG
jgi:molybdopterin converting factor subunit 1